MNAFHMFFKALFKFSLLFFVSAVLFSAVRAAGEVDPTFDAAVQNITAGSVETIVVQADGKLLVGGNFTVANNTARTNIVRFNADGTVDQTFNPPDFYKATQISTYALNESFIYAVALQSDGKIIVGGNFNRVGISLTQRGLVRLNADGSIDNSFVIPPFDSGSQAVVYNIKIQSNNQIIVGGNFYFQEPNGFIYRQSFARLNTNGSIDASFNPFSFAGIPSGVGEFAIQPDGKIIYAGSGGIRRINSDSSPDNSFALVTLNSPTGGGGVLSIVIQDDGKVLVGGFFSTVNGFTQNSITRLNTDGTLDSSFNTNGTGSNQEVRGIAILPDGKISIVGSFTTFNSVQRTKSARLNANGTLDTTYNYNPGTTAVINDVQSLGDGRVVIGGVNLNGNMSRLARINADGSVDSSFLGRIYTKGSVSAVYAQPDGKVLVGGLFTSINGVARLNFARLNQDGSVDTGFVADAVNPNSVSPRIRSIGLQTDGKIIINGGFLTINGVSKPGTARLNTDGSVDTSFTAAGGGPKLIVLPDNKISLGTARLNSNGSLDSSFNPASLSGGTIFGFKVQPDGKVVIGGSFTQVNGVPRGRVARLNADGTLDETFNPPFGANEGVNDLVIQSDGKVVIGGSFTGVNGVSNRRYLARLNVDGSLDTSFNPNLDGYINVVEKQSDGKILIGGEFGILYGVAPYDLARLNQDGSFDSTFAGPGANEYVRSIFVQIDNKILVGGDFSRVNNISRVGVARLLNSSAPSRTLFDYDGDGRADLSVFRPANGVWYVLSSQNNSFSGIQFGSSNDKIAPADYDGDGKTDLAVFRENIAAASTGAFYILNSADNSYRPVAFGSTGDVPVSGDWDGDGKADPAVYRDGSLTGGASLFIYRPSSAPGVDFRVINWGAAGDKPVVGDYDGDGKLDAAIFRPSIAQWYILRSSNNQFFNVQFGQAGDVLAPADYTGDGVTDVGVFRPSNGTWYYSSSQTTPSTNFVGVQFGISGDLPVPADYDGDGKADVAVFRPSNGIWYLNRSTQGFTGVQFGANGDKPAENAYVR